MSDPILEVSEVAGRVSRGEDYSLCARAHCNDEVGILVGAFNQMLERIQQRDVALKETHVCPGGWRIMSSSQTTLEQIVQTIFPHRGVLVAEDDPMFRKILQNWLQSWDYKVIVAMDGTEAWSILQQERPSDLLILDWVMPGINGMELCRRVRERQSASYQYILIVTANDDRQDVVRWLEAGADDYLTKPFDKGELRARLRAGTRILTLQEDLIRAREDLRFQPTHDVLTGIWNRRAVLDLLHREIERAARFYSSTGVLMIDLDHFKKINDTYGHLTGDAVLKETAQRIASVVRSYDFVGRYGGEEFLVLLPVCDKEQAEQSGERIRLAVMATPWSQLGLRLRSP